VSKPVKTGCPLHAPTQNSVVSNDELYVRSLRDAAGVGVQRTTWLRWCRVMDSWHASLLTNDPPLLFDAVES
jgi:hypothetical protein